MARSSDDDPPGQEQGERDHDDREAAAAESEAYPRSRFALVLIIVLGTWKSYEAVVAPTMRIAIPPSLYTAGLGAFAVSLLGPRRVQLVTFFAGAVLCLLAIALEVPY